MKKYLPHLLISAVTVTALTLLSFSPAKAQIARSGLAAIPPRAGDDGSLSAKPGETIQTSIKVRNTSDTTLTIISEPQDFIIADNGRTPIPITSDTSNRWSLASWMVLVPGKMELKPGEIEKIQVVIEVPEDALPGGHYAMITHRPTNEPLEDLQAMQVDTTMSSVAAVTNRVGTLFYLTVEGSINEEAYVRNLKFDKFQEFGPVPYSFEINNQSDIHIKPRIRIDIYNLIGQKVDSLQPETNNVFPLSTRDYAGKWEKIWGFGPYTAKLVMSYGTSGQVALVNSTFWVMPIRIILAAIFTLLVILAIVGSIRRHLKHRYEQEEATIKELQKQLDEYKNQQE